MNETYHRIINDWAVYAVRYAINRGSYANGTTAEQISICIRGRTLEAKTVSVIARDVKEALESGVIPYDDQKDEWQKVLQEIGEYFND